MFSQHKKYREAGLFRYVFNLFLILKMTLYKQIPAKPGFHIVITIASTVCKHILKLFHVWFGLHIVVIIESNKLSQEILSIDIFTAIKSPSNHSCKHFLRSLQLY